MKNIIIPFILLFIIFQSYSQDITYVDIEIYRFKYLLTYQSDSTDINSVDTEEMVLLIGSKVSKFVSSSAYLRDSLARNIDKENLNSLNLMTLFRSIPKTKFKDKIFKNYPSDKITVTEQVLKDYYKYEEPMKLFDWKVESETKDILGFNCQKAITKYAGRNYVAWFTDEIPISDGPYKFNGLPGLIIQINDSKNHYEYKLVSFKKVDSDNKIIINNKNYIKTSKKDFYKVKEEFYKNIFKKLEQSGISINFENPSQKKDVLNKYRKQNNPIELKLD